jgi:hypothetical protein
LLDFRAERKRYIFRDLFIFKVAAIQPLSKGLSVFPLGGPQAGALNNLTIPHHGRAFYASFETLLIPRVIVILRYRASHFRLVRITPSSAHPMVP